MAKNLPKARKLTSKERLEIVEKVLKKGEPVGRVCHQKKISRSFFYSLRKKYLEAGETRKEKLKALRSKKEWVRRGREFSKERVEQIIKVILKNPEYGIPKILEQIYAKKKKKIISHGGVQIFLRKLNLNTKRKRKAFVKQIEGLPQEEVLEIVLLTLSRYKVKETLSPEERLKAIRLVEGGVPVAQICRSFHISRKNFYKWKKRYEQSAPGREHQAVTNKKPVIKRYWRQVTDSQVERILKIIVKHPEYSTHKIAKLLPFIGNHGVQNVFRRLNLNLYEKRLAYAKQFAPKPLVTPVVDLLDRLIQLIGKIPVVSAIPPPSRERIASSIPPFALSFFSSVIFSSIFIYWLQTIAQAPTVGAKLGLFFASLSLLVGSFFFAYSMKYYLTLALVLSFSRRSLEEGEGLAVSLNGRLNGFLNGNGGGLGGLLGRIFGLNGSTSSGSRRSLRDKPSVAKAMPPAGGLQPSLDHIKLKRHPFVSIHLPLYNEKRVAKRIIKACMAMDYPSTRSARSGQAPQANYEVIVCDDSNDETVEIIKNYQKSLGKVKSYKGENGETISIVKPKNKPTLKVIHRKTRKGFKGGALAEALKHMNKRTEFIAVFDADFIPYPDTLELFLKYFQVNAGGLDFGRQEDTSEVSLAPLKRGNSSTSEVKKKEEVRPAITSKVKSADALEVNSKKSSPGVAPKIAVVSGYQWHVLNKSENWITRGVRAEYAGSYVIERPGRELLGLIKQISGSAYMIRSDILKKIGWGTSLTEDFQLTLKLYEAGYKVIYTPYVQAPAECVSTLKRLIRQRMRWAEGHSFNIKKMFLRLMFGRWEILDPSIPGKLRPTPEVSTQHTPGVSKAVSSSTSEVKWVPSPLTLPEKLEFLYLAPYYLQSFFFLLGTFSWLLAEAVFRARLPFWTSLWGWSLVLTNFFSLPLINTVGLFLEESEEKDYVGLLSFVFLSYILVPFQAYASLKGFLKEKEGPWFRTPKTGKITDIFTRGRFYRWISGILPRRGLDVAIAQATAMNKAIKGSPDDIFYPFNHCLSLATANNQFNRFSISPRKAKWLGKVVLVILLTSSILISSLAPAIPFSLKTKKARAFGSILGPNSLKEKPQALGRKLEKTPIEPTVETGVDIVNSHSHPQAGDIWEVYFKTKGRADLTITPMDEATIDDLDFVSLTCDGQERAPQILENDVIFYPNWESDGEGKVTYLVDVAGNHRLEFRFGDDVEYAYNQTTYQVSANDRDAWDDGSSGSLTSARFGDLNWNDAGGYQWSLPIPQGATINSAYISVYSLDHWGATGAYTARIRVEDVDNAAAFTGAAGNIKTARTYWTTTVDWSIPSGGLPTGTWSDSPDITSLVQHIVNRAGWASGNYLGIGIWGQTGAGGSAEDINDYNDNTSLAAKLIISWTSGNPPTNDSLTFTNPYGGSGNSAVADNSTEWNFRAVVSDLDGYTNLTTVKLRLADSSDNSAPYTDLEFTWTQATDTFSETGTDTLSAATLSANSSSSSSGNTSTLDFKIKFNDNFATKNTNYNAQLYTTDDDANTDEDTYTNFYQVLHSDLVDSSTSSSATAYSFQRKTWWDGSRLWSAFHSGTEIEFWYSEDWGATWSQNTSATLSISTNDFSIEADSENAFITYTNGDDIEARKAGTALNPYPATNFAWDAATIVYDGTGAGGAWWNSNWPYRFKYTIDNSGVGETLTDFPLHIDLTNDAPAAFWTNVSFEDGRDIRIIDEDDTTDLTGQAHLEDFSKASSKGHIWVKRTIAAAGNTEEVYIYYGNSSATAAWNKENTYNANYVGVWHLDETSGTHYDATSNNNDSTTIVVTQQGANIGAIGPADEFDGVDDYVGIPDSATLDGMATLTVEVWFKLDTTPPSGEYWGTVQKQHSADPWISYNMALDYDAAGGSTHIELADSSQNKRQVYGFIASAGTWYHAAATYAGSDIVKIYQNGADSTSSSWGTAISGNILDSDDILEIGGGTDSPEAVDGVIDEVRISNVARSAEWLEFAYLSDKGDAGTAGTQEEASGDEYDYPTITRDTNNKIWITTAHYSGTNYLFKAIQSTNANDVSLWGTASTLDTSANSNKYGVIVPLTSGDMYATWIDGTKIEGRVYDSSDAQWEDSTGETSYPDGIDTGVTGLSNNISAVSDSSGNIHLAYVDASNNVDYKKYTIPSRGYDAPIFASSFEGGDSNLCDGGDGWTTGVCDTGNTAVGNETSTVYSLTYGARFTSGGTKGKAYVKKTLSTSYQTLYTRMYFRLDYEDLTSYKVIDLTTFHTVSEAQYNALAIEEKPSGDLVLQVYDTAGNKTQAGSEGYIQLDTWYQLEWKVYRHPTAGTIDVWLDGNNIISVTNADTGDANLERVTAGLYWSNTYNNQVFIDNVVVDDAAIGAYPWGSAVTLDSNAGNEYPTISINTSNNDLYAIWIRGDDIYYKKGVSPYGSANWDATATSWQSEGTNNWVTSNYSGAGMIFALWTEGSASPYSINWDYIIIPENLWLFLILSPFAGRVLKKIKKKNKNTCRKN